MANNSSSFSPATIRKNRGDGGRVQPPAGAEKDIPEKLAEETTVPKESDIKVTPAVEAVEAEAPKEEVKEAPKVSAPVKVAAPVAAATDPITAQITVCLNEYKKLLSGNRISRNQSAQAMAFLKKATDLMIAHPTLANLSAMWTFQQQNKNGVCTERTALTGVNQLDKRSEQIVTVVYNAFRSRVMRYATPMRDNEIMAVVPSQRLVQFLKTAQ